MTPEDVNYRLFLLLHGDTRIATPMPLAKLPKNVAMKLGWKTDQVYLTMKDAQKIRHHPKHGMNAEKGLYLPMVITHGDYYQTSRRGSANQIEVVLHEPQNLKRAYFLVLSKDKESRGIFLRTFYFTAQLSRSKMKGSAIIRSANSHYFKGLSGV